MDYLKRKLGNISEQFEVVITPISLTLAPPPSVAVNVFLQMQRESKHNFVSKKYVVEPGVSNQRKKLVFTGETMKMTNEYSLKKNKTPNGGAQQPALQWTEKDVFLTVQCEGVGGKTQTIGTQKVNLSVFIGQIMLQPQQMVFKETVPFSPAGLVGDLELSIFFKHIQKNSNGNNALTTRNTQMQPVLQPFNQLQPSQSQAGLGINAQQQPLVQNPQQIHKDRYTIPSLSIYKPPQEQLIQHIDCSYTFTPKFLSFQGHIKPMRAQVRFRDGTARDQQTKDYWLSGSADPRMSREQTESSLADHSNNSDMNVAFTAETFSGTVPVNKDANGQLERREVIVEVYIGQDHNSEFLLLKQINMNLAQFVDTGKIDDVISFQDVGVLFVFEMEVSQVIASQQQLAQALEQIPNPQTTQVNNPIYSDIQNNINKPVIPVKQEEGPSAYPAMAVPQQLQYEPLFEQIPLQQPQYLPMPQQSLIQESPSQISQPLIIPPLQTEEKNADLESKLSKQQQLIDQQNLEIDTLKAQVQSMSEKVSQIESKYSQAIEDSTKRSEREDSMSQALKELQDEIEKIKKTQLQQPIMPPMIFPPHPQMMYHPMMMNGPPGQPNQVQSPSQQPVHPQMFPYYMPQNSYMAMPESAPKQIEFDRLNLQESGVQQQVIQQQQQ